MSDELPPIRCVTCNKVLAHKWQDYQDMISKGVRIETALNRLGLDRPCCRIRMRNPFKVVDINPQTQEDVNLMVQSGIERLSIQPDRRVDTGPALAITSQDESGGMMVESEDEEIELPDIPEVDTSKIPGTVRSYRAW